jgi:hypothetical protein
MGNYISTDSYLLKHECSGRNITWQYIRHNGTLSYPYNTCADAQVILDSHNCRSGKCHPTWFFDKEYERYELLNWDGLGDPYQVEDPGHKRQRKRSELPIQPTSKSGHMTEGHGGISDRPPASLGHQQTGFMRPANSAAVNDSSRLGGKDGKKFAKTQYKNGTTDETHRSSGQPQTGFLRPEHCSDTGSKHQKGKIGKESKRPHGQLGDQRKPQVQDPSRHPYKPDDSLIPPNPFNDCIPTPNDVQKTISGPRFTDQYPRHGDHHVTASEIISGVLFVALIIVLGLAFCVWYKKARKPRWMRGHRCIQKGNVGPWNPRAEEETLMDDLESVA